MPVTAFKFPGTMVGNRTVTGSDADWTNPDNAKADDGSVAQVTLTAAGDESSGLAASNFDFSEIPVGAQILGIEIRVGDYEVDGVTGGPEWKFARLILADGSDGSENKGPVLANPQVATQTDEAGGAVDVWSALGDDFTRADVQDVDFGFFVSVTIPGAATTTFDIDFMQMRVFWAIGTDWKFPGTMAGNRGTGLVNWINPDNAKADDTSDATAIFTLSGETRGLAASNFDFSVIPAGATIDGIQIRLGDYRADQLGGTPTWGTVRLILADDSDGSENKTLESPTTDRNTDEAGGAADLWSENLSRADVQDVDFGFFVKGDLGSSATTEFQVDFMQMRVLYHEGLPTTIHRTGGRPGFSPPWKSSAGDFYVVLINRDTRDSLKIFKTTDPTADSWIEQDTPNNPISGLSTGDYSHVTAHQRSDLLHTALYELSDVAEWYEYNSFSMATDLYVTTGELIDNVVDPPSLPWISFESRTGPDLVVVYNGATDRIMGGDKQRVDANVRTGGSWDGPIALDAAGDIHYGAPNVVKASDSERMHILWSRKTTTVDPPTSWTTVEGRTLDPSDVLSASVQSGWTPSVSLLPISNIVSYDDGGTERIIGAAIATFTEFQVARASEDGSANLDNLIVTDFIPTEEPFVNGDLGLSTLNELNDDLHLLYSGGGTLGVDQDLYYTTSTDDGATWATPTKEIDAITVNFLSANIYTRGGDTVLAYVYDDNGVQKYNEKILIAGGNLDASVAIALSLVADLKGQGKLDAAIALLLTVAPDLKATGQLDAAIPMVLSLVADLKAAAAGLIDATVPLALTVTPDLTGDGKLDAAPALLLSIAADLKGAGKLDAALALAFAISADARNVGFISAAPALVLSVAADLTAQGKLDAAAALAFAISADLKAGGQLDAAPAMVISLAADLKARGKLDAAAALVLSIAADLTARGKLDATVPLLLTLSPDLKAAGKLDAAIAMALTLSADLAAAGKLDAAVALALSITADLKDAAAGAIAATVPLALSLSADLKADGELDAAVALIFAVTPDLKALGTLDANPSLVISVAADLKAAGQLDAAVALVLAVTADLKARGKLDAAPALVLSLAADLRLVGELDAAVALVMAVSADLKAAGKLDAAPPLLFTITPDLKAEGKLDAAIAMALTLAADLKADGQLDAAVALAFSISADLQDAGGGQISASIPLALSLSADLTADGKLDAAVALAFSVTANLAAQGKLDAAPALALTVAADLRAQGKLDAAIALTMTVAADLKAQGKLDAALALALTVAGDLKALGKLDAAIPMTLAVIADLKAQGKLDAAIALALTVAGDLKATGDLDATIALALTLAADLTAIGKLDAAVALAFSLVADLKDAGADAIAATVPLVFTVSPDLKAVGKLDATLPLALAVVANLRAAGKLDSAVALALAISADLQLKGKLNATAAMLFALSADLKAQGKLDAAAALVLSATANLTAKGKLDAAVPLQFSINADARLVGGLDALSAMTLTVSPTLTATGQLEATSAMTFTVSPALAARGALIAAVLMQLSLTAALLDASGRRIPNSIQDIIVSLFNSFQEFQQPPGVTV